MQPASSLTVLQQYQRLLLEELKQLERTAVTDQQQQFDGLRETIAMIFSKLAERELHTLGSTRSLKPMQTARCSDIALRMSTEQQQLYSELVARNNDIQRADRKFLRRLEKLEILLYQKDYEEALLRIDGFKKNNITFETEEASELKSVSDSINQAFLQSEMKEREDSTMNAYTAALKIVQDDEVSLDVKEEMVLRIVKLLTPKEEDTDEELKHVGIEEVLEARRAYDQLTTSPFSIELLGLPTDRFKGNESLFANENKHPFENRMILKSLKYLDEESPILSRESLKQVERKLHIPEARHQQTGKKKPQVDASCLNNISEVFNSETGKKVIGKRERSMTSRKREPTDDKKSKTLTKDTEKKRVVRKPVPVVQPLHLKTYR